MEVRNWHELEVLFWSGGASKGKGMGVVLASRRGLMELFCPCMCVSVCLCMCAYRMCIC